MQSHWWQKENRELIYRYVRRFRPYRRINRPLVFYAALGSVLTTGVGLALPWITMQAVDRIVYSGHITTLVYLLVAWLIAVSIRSLGTYLTYYNLLVFRQRMVVRGQITLMKHILHLPVRYFKKANIGYIVCRVRDDISSLQPFWAGTLIVVAQSIVTIVVSLVLLFVINTNLTIVMLLLTPVYLLSSFLFLKRIRALSYDAKERAGIAEGKLHESFSGAETIKELGLETITVKGYFHQYKKAVKTQVRLDVLEHVKNNMGQLLQALVPVLIFCYSGYLIYLKALTVGEFIGFSVYVGFLLNPLSRLFSLNSQIQRAMAPLQRVFEIMDMPGEATAHPSALSTSLDLKGDVQYVNVSFSYNGSNLALDDVNVHIKSGSTVGFCGTSGAGKSTFMYLLLRAYELKHGDIFIDGHNINDIPLHILRKNIGIVSQDIFLFNDTIFNNLICGNKNIPRDHVEHAARLANAHDFIRALKHGYDTAVGVRGLQLSGGQRARLSIARALLRNPAILVFDEATAFMDSQTERLFREATANLFRDRTVITISHRISSVMRADQIYVFDKAKIIQSGKHDELAGTPGLYQRLCHEQMRNAGEVTDNIQINGYHSWDR